jgi:hypothetical protein
MRTRDPGLRALHRIVRAIGANKQAMSVAEWEWLLDRLNRVEYRECMAGEAGVRLWNR